MTVTSGQVGATMVRIVQDKNIATLHVIFVFANDRFNALSHAAQMDGHVRCIGNQMPFSAEQSAREIQTLFDVDGVGCILQLQAHLFGNVHEQVIENLQQHRVDRGARSVLVCRTSMRLNSK